MIFSFDSITLSFLVVAIVTLAVVVVLVWYVYSSKKFRQDIIDLMDEKLSNCLDNLEPKKEEEEPHDFEVNTKPTETEEEQKEPQSFPRLVEEFKK